MKVTFLKLRGIQIRIYIRRDDNCCNTRELNAVPIKGSWRCFTNGWIIYFYVFVEALWFYLFFINDKITKKLLHINLNMFCISLQFFCDWKHLYLLRVYHTYEFAYINVTTNIRFEKGGAIDLDQSISLWLPNQVRVLSDGSRSRIHCQGGKRSGCDSIAMPRSSNRVSWFVSSVIILFSLNYVCCFRG